MRRRVVAAGGGKQALVWLLVSALELTSCVKHYKADGMVLRVEPEKRTVVISHRDVKGLMPAMTMPFAVKRASELAPLAPGTRVHFELAVSRRGTLAGHFAVTAGKIDDLRLAPSAEKLSVGAVVPDFSLTDETGRAVHLSDFRRRVIALDFIYTRCPLPDVCPRLSANFARLERRFASRLGSDLVLLSISIDPRYDSPEVLSRYARIWKANPAGWHFLTGGVDDIRAVAAHFGMIYWPEEGSMTHTAETAIVSREGRLAGVVEGSGYAVSQLGDLIALQLDSKEDR